MSPNATSRGLSARLAAAVLVFGLASCSGPETIEEDTPDRAALRLFELARMDEPGEELLASCLEGLPEPDRRAALYDALATLETARDVRVAGVEPLPGLDRTAVDLTAGLPAGGQASFSVHLTPGADGGWRVVWFGGPDADWPATNPTQGDGLTSSPAPER